MNKLLLILTFSFSSAFLFGQEICLTSVSDYTFEAPGNARCITKGDFNNDGNLDIVIGNALGAADPNAQRLYFLNNTGGGIFEPPVQFQSGSRPLDVKSADFNNDGNLDLVVVNNNLNRMAVILGNGDGTFQAPVGYDTEFGPNSVAVADFNGNGVLDIAVTTRNNSGTVNLFIGDVGTPGAFAPFVSIPLTFNSEPSDIVAGDVNSDGNIDLITANTGTDNVGVLIGDGTGGFAAVTDYPSDVECIGVAVADMNNNGHLDIITANNGANTASVLLNNGAGGFAAPVNYTADTEPQNIEINDVNNDGIPDAVLVNSTANTISVFIGNADGTLQPQLIASAINNPRNLISGDFTGNSNVDVIVSCLLGQEMPIFVGDGTGVYSLGSAEKVGNNPNSVGEGDFNGDGPNDFVVLNSSDNQFALHLGDSTGVFTFNSSYPTSSNPSSIIAVDLNNDGLKDVVVSNYSDNNVSVYLNSGGAFSAATNFDAGNTPLMVKTGDINGDGNKDIIVLNENNEFNVLLGNGAGSLSAPTNYATGTSPSGIDVGDHNLNGFSDVVVSNRGDNNIGFYANNGAGTLGAPTAFNVGNGPSSVTFGDLNGDDYPEIITTNFASNNITVHTNMAPGYSAFAVFSANYSSTDTGPQGSVVSDVDGDGNNDVMVINEVNVASTGNVALFLGDGTNNLTFEKRFALGMDPRHIIKSDFTGNGKDDFAIANFGSNTVSILLNISAVVEIRAFGPTEFCTGDSVQLEANLAGSYLWSNGETTQSIYAKESGDYSVQTSNGLNQDCSATSNIITVTVEDGPTLTFSGDLEICEGESTTITVSGADTYEWEGIGTGDTQTLSPATTTTYTVTGSPVTGCDAIEEVTITVNPLPNADFNNLDATYCESSTTVALVPVISGGTFSGNGVSGNEFEPSVAGIGTHTITYDITDANGCQNSSSQAVEVTSSLDASFTGLASDYCIDDGSATLTPATAGGTFSGTGITGNDFDPAVAGVATHIITYEVSGGGCTESSSQSTTVNPLPDPSFSGLDPEYCLNDDAVTLTPTTTGGTFSGPGITGSDFDPADAGVGVHTITYSITDANGCSDESSQDVEVLPLPDADFTGLDTEYCVDDATVTLTPNLAGGTFSGSGITGNDFNPSAAGDGTHTITYTVTGANGCTDSTSQTTIVHPLPDPTFSGLAADYCLNDAIVTLTPTTTGGTFSGNGITGNDFNPADAGVGVHTITYSITDANGCSDESSQDVEVLPLPDASFTGLDADYCVDDVAVTLAPNLAGGTFSGPGITGSDFNPADAGDGTHTITYTITDGNGCTDSTSQTTIVHPLPDPSFTGLDPEYCVNNAAVTLTPATTGGTFSGTGITGNDFDPAVAGVGDHTITYDITDANGCTNSSSQDVTVHPLPDPSFSGLDPEYCANDEVVTLTPSTAGGTFSGPGVIDNEFDPSIAEAGNHTITYSITDANGCSDESSQDVEVLPILDPTFSGLNAEYCVDNATATLTPATAGGTFSGPGITGNEFNPSDAGLGDHTVTYTITAANGCTSSSSQEVTVHPLPDPTFYGLNAEYCLNNDVVILTPETAGGTFSGPGITDNEFDPEDAGVGNHTITYSVTDGNGCTNQSSRDVEVLPLPDADFSGLNAEYCVDGDISTLIPNIDGGIFNGPGISGVEFDPAVAGVGDRTITYTITGANGCTNISSQTTTIHPLPIATFNELDSDYCEDSPIVDLVPDQTGGTFSGPGVTGDEFDPSEAGIGTHTITYEITDGNSCSSSSSQTLEVNDNTLDATFTTLSLLYCANEPTIQLIPNSPGGSFSGPGIIDDVFDPSLADIGINLITYEVSNEFGCTDMSYQYVVVNSIPDAGFYNLDETYCENNEDVTLIPNTSGGTFSGPGIIDGNVFSPALASDGTHAITYEVTDGNGCSNSSSQEVTVYPLPDPSFNSIASDYCVDADSVELVPNQDGGTFSGSGVIGSEFYPSQANIGDNTITYTITDDNGCTNSSSQTVVVNSLPVVEFTGLATKYCEDDEAVDLIPITTGGEFSGDGVIESTFNPQEALVGENIIIYTLTDENGCTNSSSDTVSVFTLPNPSFSGLDSVYCQSDVSVVLTAEEEGGVFSGNGIANGNIFYPSLLNEGTTSVTYAISSNEVCFSSQTDSVQILLAPDMTVIVNDFVLEAVEEGEDISYQWYNCDADTIMTDSTDRFFEPKQSGYYAVIISNNNCVDTSDCVAIYFANEFDEDYINLYPNPNIGSFTIDINQAAAVNVYDAVGKHIYSDDIDGKSLIQLGHNIAPGVYIVRIRMSTGETHVRNVVINR